MGGVEVFKDGQAFLEVRDDRRLDDLARGLGHQAAHAAQLLHLGLRTTGAGVGHHEDGVDVRLLALDQDARLGDFAHHLVSDLVRGLGPGVDDLVVLLTLGDQTISVLLLVFFNLGARFRDHLFLLGRDDDVVLAHGNAGLGGFTEAQLHHLVGEDDRRLLTAVTIDLIDQVTDFLLGQVLLEQAIADVGVERQQRAQLHPARGRVDHLRDLFARSVHLGPARLDLGVQADDLGVQGRVDLTHVGEQLAFARLTVLDQRQVVQTQDDVLRRHDDRLAVGGRQDVVRRHHQDARFELRFQRQRDVNSHLVAVEVGVERGTDQRVQADGLALDQLRLERLDAQTVKRRRAVQHDRVFPDHFFQDVPDLRLLALDHALGLLDGARQALGVQTRIDEGLEQLQRHLFGQAALVQLQLGAHGDDRTARVVDALAQKVLTEAALLALQHVGQRLQRTLVGARDDATTTTVVEQGVDRLLQHPLFVTDDDVGRAQLDQALQAVVTVDDPAIQVVQVRRREAAAVQRHQRTQFRRDDRHDGQDHPLGLVARLEEGLDQLQALGRLLGLHFRRAVSQLAAVALGFGVQVDAHQQVADGLGADFSREAVVAVFFLIAIELVFRQQLVLLQRGQARLGDDVVFEVEDAFHVLQRHVQHQRDARRQRLQEPDVGDRGGQVDVTHALAANASQRDFNAALLADDALVLHALVLAAQAFVVLGRAKDTGAEQAVTLGLERPVVDGFRLLDLAERPRTDLLRRGQGDLDLVEGRRDRDRVEDVQDFLVHLFSFCGNAPRKFIQRGEAVGPPSPARRERASVSDQLFSSSTFRPSERISLMSTLKLSGMPASKLSSPRTIAS
ncbi:hypothetical protein D3C86_920390 [compost metagenome]